MSSQEPLGPYRIGERVGTTVWLAEDTRNGKRVAVKLLSKQLPKDPGRRDTLIRDVRVSAALYHTFLVPILEVAPLGDNLVLVMEALDAQPIGRVRKGKPPLSRDELLRVVYQLADVVKFLEMKTLLHLNINADSVMVTDEGQIRLGGLNLLNLLPRRDGTSTVYQQKGSDARSVAYMAPELITGSTQIDERADVFSIGVLMYELATGRLPFAGTAAPDIARAIVEGNPANPKALNPNLDNQILNILAGSLFKDSFKRFRDAKTLVDGIAKIDPASVQFAAELSHKTVTGPTAESEKRPSILFIADLANYDELAAEGPDAGDKAAARMQQILGEAVYLFDGQVLDPFGRRMVADLPTVDAAFEAARKGEFDFSPGQQDTGPLLHIRMLLHAGEITQHEGVVGGPAIEKAAMVLDQLPSLKLHVSEDFVKIGRGNVRLRDAGARGGVKLYTIVEPEPHPEPLPETELAMTTAEIAEEARQEAEELAHELRAKKRRGLPIALAAAVAFLLVIGAGAAYMWKRRAAAADNSAQNNAPVILPASAAHPRKVLIAPIGIEGTNANLPDRATAIRIGAIEVLRSFPEVRVESAAGKDVETIATKLRDGAAGPELVAANGKAAAVPDLASGINALVEWTRAQVKAPARPAVAPVAMNAFADALLATQSNDSAKAELALRTATGSDPNFLAAQVLAMRFFEQRGNVNDSLAAAKQVVALDPTNVDAARKVARATLAGGDVTQAFTLYGKVLHERPLDAEALNVAARYAASTGDRTRFAAALRKLRMVPAQQVQAHEPDLMLASGHIEQAADKYYDVEASVPNNPALSLKIGRIAVLRRTLPIAELEQKKLSQLDPVYGYHMLNAYIAAENEKRDEAEKELKLALAASTPGDDAWTCAAEVYALLADNRSVMAALEKAAQRKEPTAGYILANPLFTYLHNEPAFQQLRQSLAAEQTEIRAAVARLPI